MENEGVISKDMKVEIPEITSPSGLVRQGSITKHNCLCSPTKHAGSFRCRLHRGPGPKSIDSQACQDSQSKVNPVCSVPKSNNAVDAN